MKMNQFPVRVHFFESDGYGCIEAPVENPLAEIAAAEVWLQKQGCRVVYGPLGVSTWFPYRSTLGPFERPYFFGESNFSSKPWVDSGYEIAATYTSNLASNQEQIQSSLLRGKKLMAEGWKCLSIEAIELEEVLKACHRISQRAFSNAFCYRDISQSDFLGLYMPLVEKLDPRLILLAVSPGGDFAGFCLSYPDISNPMSLQFVLKSLAVDPGYAGKGIGSWLVGEAHRQAHSMGMINGGIHALMWEGSFSTKISGHVGQVIRRYALYRKQLG
jgi:GNAT superfamily N-acetyltransferase